ncbi:stimulated by retinoic acid gene 6 protein-like isoform X2 [Nematostella vectensis]|uniref:stimulated by retinoic acid gene 6 protein-like isoform X2 n=1 Tax=Nematostella vectensis TaxID=45351 RepID=UPI0020773643|nr:stimulated by retinoic acid gene 6 protein-like isoform X2 [Nematostella vectensis]
MSSETPETECSPFNTEIFDLACLGPAFAILIGLSFFVKRKNSQVCRGRFGVLIPMNFLQDHHKNRLVFAMVFGAVSGSCINLAVSAIFGVQLYAAAFNSPWKKAFTKVAMVLLYVVLNYPFFACLSTNQQLVGAILGMAYTLLRLVGLLVAVSYCTNPYNVSESTGILQYSGALEQLPVIICHIILFLCFCRCLTKKILKRTEITNQASRHPSVAEEHDKIHVRLLLRNQLESSTVNTDRWYIKLLKKIYTTRTDFKFSTQIVSMFAVIAVSIYAMTVAELVAAEILRKVIPPEFGPYYQHIWHVIVIDSCIAAAVICTTLTILQMLHFAKCHRDHVLLSFKTRSYRKPSHLVGQSLSYCGFQIGYTILSMIILFIFLLLLFGIMAITVLLLPRLEEKVKLYLKNLILSILPVLVVTVLIMVIQKLLTLFVFRDRQLPDVTVTIDNQRLFCVMSLVFFMNNVIVGIASAVSRGLKSLILGFVFLPRIDRTPLMQQYQYWDKGYLSYVGFINVLKAHSHPVMLVFCQLLLNATWQRHTNNAVDIGEVAFVQRFSQGGLEEEGRPPVFRSRPAANRWFVAVTLLRNPGLAKYRKSDDLVLQNALERNKMQRSLHRA